MADHDELTLTIHGLNVFNGDVDGEVFARKFFKFMQGLAEADKAANGRRCLSYLISGLVKNTATAKVREQVIQADSAVRSGIAFYEEGVRLIYEDLPAARHLPRQFVKYVVDVTTDVGSGFERGEIKRSSTGSVVFIDAHLREKARVILADINRAKTGAVPYFAGSAHGSFDGTLQLLDALHGQERAVLVLTAGGHQVDCDISGLEPASAGSAYKRRCVVVGMAHYDGATGLPARIVATNIAPVLESHGLQRWRGMFEPMDIDDDWNEM